MRMVRKMSVFIGIILIGFMLIGDGYLYDHKYFNTYANLEFFYLF